MFVFCVFEGLNFERFTARGFDLFFRLFEDRLPPGRIRAIQNTPKTPARSGSGLCLFSLFRRDRLRQLRKNTDMHPLVGNNLIEKLDSYCGRLCQLFGIVFSDTLDQLLIGGNRIFFGLDIDPNSLGSRFIFDRNRRTRYFGVFTRPPSCPIKSPKRSKCFISTKSDPQECFRQCFRRASAVGCIE